MIRVLAPWSMEKRMRRIFERFQIQNPGVTFELRTGTPSRLAKRLREGYAADISISMGPVGLELMQQEGLIQPGTGRTILTQGMVLICSEEIKDILKDVKDLAKPEVKRVGVARPTMSAGTFARGALEKAGILEIVEAKSHRSPLRSLLKDEVDAGIIFEQCCYQEDLVAGRLVPQSGVTVVKHIPDELVPRFPIIAIAVKGKEAPQPVHHFVDYLADKEAQEILLRIGPEACPVCDGETVPVPK
jgi:molybdate transport system substrate-binding protein